MGPAPHYAVSGLFSRGMPAGLACWLSRCRAPAHHMVQAGSDGRLDPLLYAGTCHIIRHTLARQGDYPSGISTLAGSAAVSITVAVSFPPDFRASPPLPARPLPRWSSRPGRL